MLEILAKNDKTWRIYAYKICKDEDLANDLVGDMYIKLHNKQIKEINLNRYVYRTLQSVFLERIRKKRQLPTVSIDLLHSVEIQEIENKHLSECLEKLKWFDREILILTHTLSLREAERETGVHYGVLQYHKQKALKKLKKIYNG